MDALSSVSSSSWEPMVTEKSFSRRSSQDMTEASTSTETSTAASDFSSKTNTKTTTQLRQTAAAEKNVAENNASNNKTLGPYVLDEQMLGLLAGKEDVQQQQHAPPHIRKSDYIRMARENGNVGGITAAFMVIGLWFALEIYGVFFHNLHTSSVAVTAALFLATTYLYTGLFITAHDAMHGVVAPHHRWLNDAVGRLCVTAYACFDYGALVDSHWEHHRHTGQPDLDPDFHDGKNKTLLQWYFGFMLRNAQPLRQGVGMSIIFWSLYIAGVPAENLVVLWALPAIVSSWQLFYFGTYLVHRDEEADSAFPDKHNARTLSMPMWMHTLSCYNFTLHHEHHLLPFVPWWRLPTVHNALLLQQQQQQQQQQKMD